MQAASALGDFETVKVIWNYYLHTDSLDDLMEGLLEGLFAACRSGKLDIIKFLIPYFPEDVSFLLFTPCVWGHLDIVTFLIEECGCDPHCTDVNGRTPLHATCTKLI